MTHSRTHRDGDDAGRAWRYDQERGSGHDGQKQRLTKHQQSPHLVENLRRVHSENKSTCPGYALGTKPLSLRRTGHLNPLLQPPLDVSTIWKAAQTGSSFPFAAFKITIESAEVKPKRRFFGLLQFPAFPPSFRLAFGDSSAIPAYDCVKLPDCVICKRVGRLCCGLVPPHGTPQREFEPLEDLVDCLTPRPPDSTAKERRCRLGRARCQTLHCRNGLRSSPGASQRQPGSWASFPS